MYLLRGELLSSHMTESKVLSVEPTALDMVLQLRDNEPGDGEFALSIEVTGFRGPQFSYELAFVALADMKEGWVEERHGDLAVIFPKADIEKLDGSMLELTDEGLAMNNPNSPAPPTMTATMPAVTSIPQRKRSQTTTSMKIAVAPIWPAPARIAITMGMKTFT